MTAVASPVAAPVHRLPAQVLFTTVGAALAQASQALADGAREIDLSACADFDSSLLALLLQLQRESAARSVLLRLVGVPPNLRKLAALYGADMLIFPDA